MGMSVTRLGTTRDGIGWRLRRRRCESYFRLGDGKPSLDGNEVELGAEVDVTAGVLGFCCFGFLGSRLPRC
jgi:hypothetical protein